MINMVEYKPYLPYLSLNASCVAKWWVYREPLVKSCSQILTKVVQNTKNHTWAPLQVEVVLVLTQLWKKKKSLKCTGGGSISFHITIWPYSTISMYQTQRKMSMFSSERFKYTTKLGRISTYSALFSEYVHPALVLNLKYHNNNQNIN